MKLQCSGLLPSIEARPSPGFSSRGTKNQMEGPKARRGEHIFKILCWMYAVTREPSVKWGGTDFKWASGDHWHPRWRRPCIEVGLCYLRKWRRGESLLFIFETSTVDVGECIQPQQHWSKQHSKVVTPQEMLLSIIQFFAKVFYRLYHLPIK